MLVLMVTPEASLVAQRRAPSAFLRISLLREALLRNNMALDFSWESSVPQYRKSFIKEALEKRRSFGGP